MIKEDGVSTESLGEGKEEDLWRGKEEDVTG
jgi:hypothetical protein